MKKTRAIPVKLAVARETLRVLTRLELRSVDGAGAGPLVYDTGAEVCPGHQAAAGPTTHC